MFNFSLKFYGHGNVLVELKPVNKNRLKKIINNRTRDAFMNINCVVFDQLNYYFLTIKFHLK